MRLLILLGLLTALRLAVAATVPLAPDEAYYWVWSHALAPGYLDHPPMVALWIKAGTWLAGETALGVRLLGPVSAAVASWLLFDAGRALFPSTRAGAIAVLLLNASLFLGVGSVIMTPDTPLLFFWTATLWAVARVVGGGPPWWWLVAGMSGGLALDSKYTALLLWVGVGLWVLLHRRWLLRWQVYAAVLIGFVLFCPVLLWNADHQWVGLLKQGGRVGDWRPMRAVGFLGELIGGQIGLATPVVFVLCMIGMGVAVRRLREPAWALLAALSVPAVLVFVQHAIGDRVQGNWPAIIYPALALAAGAAVRDRRWIATASCVGFAVTCLAYGQAVTRFVPLPPRLDPTAIRLAGWDAVAAQVSALQGGAGFVAADGYSVASELAWWMRRPVVGTDDRWRLTALPTARIGGATGLLVRDARRSDPPDPAVWGNAVLLREIERPGSGGPGFAVFRVTAADDAVGSMLP